MSISPPVFDASAPVCIIGGGPAGLIAAQYLAQAGIEVELFEAMPTVGRKFLMAGRGGLNLTHSETFDTFVSRYGEQASRLQPLLSDFGAQQLRDWAADLGIDTFIGSSGRVFPTQMKAAPLLRAWLARLHADGVRIHTRHRWQGWSSEGLWNFSTPNGEVQRRPAAVLLALGGGSWRKLGANSAWMEWLAQQEIPLAPLKPANCGFVCHWSEHLCHSFAGTPLKNVILHGPQGWQRRGDLVISRYGVEGSLVYAASALLREELLQHSHCLIRLDLCPDRSEQQLLSRLSRGRGTRSLSTHLRRCGLTPLQIALLRELLDPVQMQQMERIAQTLKALPLTLTATRPMDEAISTAGGVCMNALDEQLMLSRLPGVFCAGEMLDWEAPTGGYLLTACYATGYRAARGMQQWLARQACRAGG